MSTAALFTAHAKNTDDRSCEHVSECGAHRIAGVFLCDAKLSPSPEPRSPSGRAWHAGNQRQPVALRFHLQPLPGPLLRHVRAVRVFGRLPHVSALAARRPAGVRWCGRTSGGDGDARRLGARQLLYMWIQVSAFIYGFVLFKRRDHFFLIVESGKAKQIEVELKSTFYTTSI